MEVSPLLELPKGVYSPLLFLESLWQEIAQTTLVVLNLVCEQFTKVHLGVTIFNLELHLLINQVKKEILHCENEKREKEESFKFKSPLKETCKESKLDLILAKYGDEYFLKTKLPKWEFLKWERFSNLEWLPKWGFVSYQKWF